MYISYPDYCHIQSVVPILCVDAVIIHEKRCLLLRRRNHPARGQLWFPGGRLYKNEMITAAALRKAFEETRLRCEFQSILSVEETLFPRAQDMTTDSHTVNVCCHLIVKGVPDVRLDNQHEYFQWVDKEEALTLSLHDGVTRPLFLAFEANC